MLNTRATVSTLLESSITPPEIARPPRPAAFPSISRRLRCGRLRVAQTSSDALSEQEADRQRCSPRVRHWNRDDMFGHEPDLQLVAPDDATDDQIVGPVVGACRGEARHRSC